MAQYFGFQWHITDDCDQRCKHCYVFAEDKPRMVMDLATIKKIFLNILHFCKTFKCLPYLVITGGDPILNPNIWNMLEMCKENDIPFSILGNPFHLTPSVLTRMSQYGCISYQLSIDGMQKTHDMLRKPGSFKTTIERIKMINESGINSAVMTTVSGINIDEVASIIDMVVSVHAKSYCFARYVPTENDKASKNSIWYITPERYHSFLEDIDAKFNFYESKGCSTFFVRKDHLWALFNYEHNRFQIPNDVEKNIIYDGCNCGNRHLTILPDASVMACRRIANSRVGNALHTQLVDIWLNEMEKYREFKSFSKCSKCELLSWCRGCPAVAYGTHGSFYANDPQCWKVV